MKIDKKIIVFIVIAIVVITLIFISYLNQSNTKTLQNTPIPTATKTANPLNISTTLQEKVYFPYLISNGSIIYLGGQGIIFYKYQNGSKQKIWKDEILGVEKVYYPQNGNFAIVRSNYPENKLTMYNFNSFQTAELNNNIQEIVWTKQEKIIYNYSDPQNKINNISISDVDGKDWQEIVNIDLFKPELALSSDEKTLLLKPTIDDLGSNFIYSLNLETKEITKLTTAGYEVNPLWNSTASKIIYYQINKNTGIPSSYLMDKSGQNKKDLKIRTIPGKAVWQDQQNIIVAVPQILENDYAYNAFFISKDEFYIINIESQKAIKLELPSPGYVENVENLFYDSQTKNLYFTSNDTLRSMKIE